MDSSSPNASSSRLIQQLQFESERQKFSEQVSTLTNRCFEICFPDNRPPAKLDGKHASCVSNCVNRILDASDIMIEHLQKTQLATGGGQ